MDGTIDFAVLAMTDVLIMNVMLLIKRCLFFFNPLQAHAMLAQEKVLNVRFAF